MLVKTHMAGGAAAGVAAAHYLPHEPILVIGAAVVGSLLPDICHTGSTIGQKAPLLSAIISGVFGHRTFTHSFVAMGLLWWLLDWLPIDPAIVWGILAGFASHLILDAATKNGVQILWPLPFKLKLPPNVRTGGAGETVVFAALIVSTIYWFAKLYF